VNAMRIVPVVGCLVGSAAAQLVTTDAGVISPELPTVKERLEWFVRDDSRELRATTRLAWAPDRRFQVDVVVPFVDRTWNLGARTTQEGLGDLEVEAKWALVRDDDVMRSDRLSLLGGLVLPTGDDELLVSGHHAGYVATPRSGLGLGTWGGSLGLGGTLVRDRHRLAAAARFHALAPDDGFDPGSTATLDLAWWYRVTPAVFAPDRDDIEVRGVVELLSKWQGDDALAGAGLANGGYDLWLVLGAQVFPTRAVGLECGVLLPLEMSTSSPFGHDRYALTVSFRLAF